MKNNKLRKFLTAFVMTFAFAIGSLTAIPTASANTGGGIGGGGGPGGAYDGFQWVSVAYGQKGRAYEKFVELSGWPRATVEQEVRGRVGNLEVCVNSNVIWFIASQGWTYNFTGATWPNNPVVAGTIENPRVAVGDRGASPAEVNAFKEWDRNSNGNRIGNTPGYTIICSGAFQRPGESWTTVDRNVWYADDAVTVTHPYTFNTAVTRQISAPSGNKTIDPIGQNNLHDQALDPDSAIKTNYGKLWDDLKKNGAQGRNPQRIRELVAEALEKDRTLAHKTVNLTENNKKGLAEGGVLNVSEFTQSATISGTERVTVTDTNTCRWTRTWNPWTGDYNAPTSSCSFNRSESRSATANTSLASLQNTGFWQMLAVHCNRDEFNALLASDPTITRISGDGANKITAVVHSKKHDTQPAILDFGDPRNSNPAKAKTGHKGFYDKECPFDCVPVPLEEPGVPEPGKLTGAVSENINSNSFEFFRDNNEREIEVQAWAPRNGVDGVNTYNMYNRPETQTTTISRWEEGTPSPDGSSGGKFSMETAEGEQLFQGKIDNKFKDNNGKLKPRVAPVQTNWNSDWHHDPFLSIINGHHTKFLLKSTWASDAGKPQILNFKWEWAPDVTSSVPVSGIGFGAGGSQIRGNLGNVSTPIEGKCYGQFGTSALQNNNVEAFGANTGTGSVNNLDNGIMGSPTPDNRYNLSTNFVRSAGE